jgi:hypothetical protein
MRFKIFIEAERELQLNLDINELKGIFEKAAESYIDSNDTFGSKVISIDFVDCIRLEQTESHLFATIDVTYSDEENDLLKGKLYCTLEFTDYLKSNERLDLKGLKADALGPGRSIITVSKSRGRPESRYNSKLLYTSVAGSASTTQLHEDLKLDHDALTDIKNLVTAEGEMFHGKEHPNNISEPVMLNQLWYDSREKAFYAEISAEYDPRDAVVDKNGFLSLPKGETYDPDGTADYYATMHVGEFIKSNDELHVKAMLDHDPKIVISKTMPPALSRVGTTYAGSSVKTFWISSIELPR